MRVLFICSGNICRSPMAEALFNHAADRSGQMHLHAESAGTLGIVGRPASHEAILALAECGIDLRPHRSRALDATAARAADVIIGMTADHVQAVRRGFPESTTHVWPLLAFGEGQGPQVPAPDLADPVGQPLETFQQQREVIDRSVGSFLSFLVNHGLP